MSLTLDDLKNVRFPIAKKNGEGYRAIEVDAFLDQVDATFSSLLDENSRLKVQLESLGEGGAPVVSGADSAELDRARGQVDDLNNQIRELTGQLDRLRAENEGLKGQVNDLQRANESHVAATGDAGAELERLRLENASLRGDLTQAQQAAEQARADAETARSAAAENEAGPSTRLVVTTSAEASSAVTRLVQLATDQAESVVAEANEQAQRTISDANQQAERTVSQANEQAHQITLDAQTRAERIQSEARVNAEQMTTDARTEAERLRSEAQAHSERVRGEAQANADRVNYDADNRRRELFAQLEAERDRLATNVDHLRSFESTYRQNLVSHFQQSIETLTTNEFAPGDVPELLTNRPGSNTPRLDALLAEGN